MVTKLRAELDLLMSLEGKVLVGVTLSCGESLATLNTSAEDAGKFMLVRSWSLWLAAGFVVADFVGEFLPAALRIRSEEHLQAFEGCVLGAALEPGLLEVAAADLRRS